MEQSKATQKDTCGRQTVRLVLQILEDIGLTFHSPNVGKENCKSDVYNNLIWWFLTLSDLISHFFNIFIISSRNEVGKCEITYLQSPKNTDT